MRLGVSRHFDALPDIHTYRGLSLRVALACRLRILAKYIVQRVLLTREERMRLHLLAREAGSRRGKSALIVAGGPSSGRLDPEKVNRAQLDGLDVFAMNMYSRSALAASVVPDFYTSAILSFLSKMAVSCPTHVGKCGITCRPGTGPV